MYSAVRRYILIKQELLYTMYTMPSKCANKFKDVILCAQAWGLLDIFFFTYNNVWTVAQKVALELFFLSLDPTHISCHFNVYFVYTKYLNCTILYRKQSRNQMAIYSLTKYLGAYKNVILVDCLTEKWTKINWMKCKMDDKFFFMIYMTK